jgi:hypothetical protein
VFVLGEEEEEEERKIQCDYKVVQMKRRKENREKSYLNYSEKARQKEELVCESPAFSTSFCFSFSPSFFFFSFSSYPFQLTFE